MEQQVERRKMTRAQLSVDQIFLLDGDGDKEGTLPRAKRWMRDNPIGSNLFEHGRSHVEYWEAQTDADIHRRYSEWLQLELDRSGQ